MRVPHAMKWILRSSLVCTFLRDQNAAIYRFADQRLVVKWQAEPFASCGRIDCVRDKLRSQTAQPRQHLLANRIDITNFRDVDDQSLGSGSPKDQRLGLVGPFAYEPAFHLEK